MNYVRNKRYFSNLYKLGFTAVFVGGFLLLAGLLISLSMAGAVMELAVTEAGGVRGIMTLSDDDAVAIGENLANDLMASREIDMIVSAGGAAMIVGGVLLGGGLVWFIVLIIRRPKDTQINEQVQEEVKKMYQKALGKHGVTEEMVQRSAPLIFGGYILAEKITAKLFAKRFIKKEHVGGGNTTSTVIDPAFTMGSVMSNSVIAVDDMSVIKYMRAQDGTVRSNLAEYTIFLFSEDKILVYTQQFSLVDPEIKESMHVYSYRDIISISSESLKYGAHAFIVKKSNGETLTVPCSNSRAAGIKESVTALMQLVRDKKN